MRIAVIGAGIAGLVAAASLQHDGHDVKVYEQRTDPNADGAGLTLFGNAFAALDAVGLSEPIQAITSNTLATLHTGQRTPDGTWLTTMPRATVEKLHTVHRVTLHNTLREPLAPGTIQTGVEAQVAADGTPRVTTGESTEIADLVLAADGLRSRNRHRLGLDTGITYSGYTAWRGVTSRPVELSGVAAETWGRGRIFGIVPLPDDTVYWFGTQNIAANTTFASEHDAVADTFAGWHQPIPECITATPPHTLLRHDVFALHKPLKTLVRGRTVLLGDAAHAMLPNLGQGAGQGIEDAVTLTLLLRHTSTRGLDATLEQYSRLRSRRTGTLWRQSQLMANVAQAQSPVATGLRNLGMRLTPAPLLGAVSQRFHTWRPPNSAAPKRRP